MPAKDIYHDTVKIALIKDGWTIIADPYTIKYKEAELFPDLAAEKLIAAEQNKRKIVVEVKSFLSPSLIRDFETALGQYILYKNFLTLTQQEYQLYLAVSERAYENLFKRDSIQEVVKLNQILLIIFDIDKEEILQWLN
ncbi:XisH family protein [Funiculus sociatus GB2-A5]|uniref:XisH family protein n=1 Tax=Funiculus sociatus GB2-A5 TaxID=2933946 RepID=A0ABV0JQN4_9CYAN|nr:MULTISPECIES: XisH family protein [unclassified Trichocoleus]MBD1908136.1 XisH family protein [Trichocoleus sp. FACHB-832]MBD2062033.1 XisH family protein [Trichocoleus sp. FACHB-6]